MTPLLLELSVLPVSGTFDGELVAFGEDGSPDFPLLCERMLMRRSGIHVTYVIFDLLSVGGNDLTRAPYSERRTQLDGLNLNGVYWQTPETFDDGATLFDAVCAHELKASSRNDAAVVTCRVNVAGSRSRTATTGGTSLSASQRSTSAA